MRMEERLRLVEEMIAERPDSLSVAVPTHALKALLKHCRDRDEIQYKYLKQREKAKYYQEHTHSLRVALKRIQKKEGVPG
ncbi:hypothetical protein B481_2016 [Planococcus halocryophilus Or1]|uniref:Uncharacterized protein n=1 Tax=Planococcus halocryophilus TaxID=1215089 RepID=A0A1C7DPU4_9BACL|nr:hypothetical protein [Planococcus halocryophilus]ANU13485.1 hypothetical protein BBI08_06350 [Planococcus halocryophilus]EMF46289.1 hypothetical protein B481_2016 [Planococcus halocryophilus Or1]